MVQLRSSNYSGFDGEMISRIFVIPNIRNNVKFGKEAAQIFCLERVTIASMARHE